MFTFYSHICFFYILFEYNFLWLFFFLLYFSRKGNIMDHMLHMLEQYSKNLEELVTNRTQALREEQSKTKDLLHRMLPS